MNITPDLSGKTALITGSTSGIGLGMARAFASAGAAVMLNGLNADCRCDVSFASARAANEDDVVGPTHELAATQRPVGGLIDLSLRKARAGEVFVSQEPRRLHVIGPSRRCKHRLPGSGWIGPHARPARPGEVATASGQLPQKPGRLARSGR